ncbi:MAG: nucleoside monophosphate kinase [Phycisphaeraceae bacterium]|nr:nucleoside monophosphate kinase [Phycisphaeraceae bacterium]
MTQPRPAVLLFGPPGVGKGTQGAILGAIPGLFHMSSGDMFRSINRESEAGRLFHEVSSRGELVPDELTIRLWTQFMSERYDGTPHQGSVVLLDGIPRSTNQARLLEPEIDVRLVIHLVCRDVDAMVARLRKRAIKQGRPDDADESVIRRRHQVYQQETAPLLQYYPPGLVREIDALGTPLAVLRQIVDVLEPALRGCLLAP